MSETPSTRWSREAKAWLVFWIVLIIATPALFLLSGVWWSWAEDQGWSGRLARMPFFLLGGAWLVGIIAQATWWVNKHRSGKLALIAEELHLHLTPAPKDDDWAAMQVFKFFRIGFDHSARNWMTGKLAGHDVAVLDYFFRRSDLPRDAPIRRSCRDYHQTVVAFWNVSPKLPPFQLVTRESWWSHMGAKNRSPKGCVKDLKVGKGINRDFYKNYLVGGPSEADLVSFFSPLLMEYFSAHRGWDVEAVDGHLLIYQETHVQAPVKLAAFLEEARQIADNLRERADGKR